MDIMVQDPDFARTYLRECIETFWVLDAVKDEPFYQLAYGTLVTMVKNMEIMDGKNEK